MYFSGKSVKQVIEWITCRINQHRPIRLVRFETSAALWSNDKQHNWVSVTCVRETWVQFSGFSARRRRSFPSSNEPLRAQLIYTPAPSCLSRLLVWFEFLHYREFPGWLSCLPKPVRYVSERSEPQSASALCIVAETWRVEWERDLSPYTALTGWHWRSGELTSRFTWKMWKVDFWAVNSWAVHVQYDHTVTK